jgi:hypothetical protein
MDTSQGTPVSPAAPAAPARKRPRASGRVSPVAAVTVASAVLVVAALAVARYSSQPAAPTAADTQLEPVPSVPAAAQPPDALPAPLAAPLPGAAGAGAETPRVATMKPRQTRVATTKKSSLRKSVPPPQATEVAASEPGESAARTVVAEPAPSAPAAASNRTAERAIQAPVTITGCLETTIQGDRFRLTDTEGAGAPKARSWRSGFLKKRPAPVELVDLSDLAGLRKYVGHRVAATGLLSSRELRVRSLESAGPSCN